MIVRFGDHEVDTGAFELRRGGTLVPLEPQVFDVLAHLITHRERVVTKEELLDEVWGDRFVSESALTSRIKAARRAIGDDGRTQGTIRTVHGRGYRFVAPVEEAGATGGADPGTGPAPFAEPLAGAAADPPVGLAPSMQPVPTRYTRSSGYEIAFQELGDGPVVVFIPGFVSNLDLHWEHPGMARFFRRLGTFSRLIMFDKRGTGVSERVPADRLPTLEERMDDLRAVLDAVGVKQASLFGISEGGPMALLFAATYPERVERLVLYGTFARDPFADAEVFVRRTRRAWGIGRVFGGLAPSWGSEADQDFLARFERQSATPEGAAALVRLTSEIDARSTLSSITAPTLVLHRLDDTVVPFDRAEVLAAGIAGAELVALDGTDHFVCVDPDPILDTIERFITGVAPRPVGERVLATMLFIDVVSSTERAAAVGDAKWRAALTELYELSDRELARAGGTRVNTTGDGFLASFDGPARAVRCGLRLVAGLGAQGVPVRCGIHTSEVERIGADLTGIGVHVAARVESLARPGEVLVTRTVRDLVAGSGLRFVARGAHPLRGVPDAWELFAAEG